MKKLTALICIASMLCTMALSAVATESPSKTPAGMREADIFDALDTLKHLVGIVKLPTALYDFKNEGDVTINSTLTVLEGLVGASEPIMLPERLKPLAEETELEIRTKFKEVYGDGFPEEKLIIDYFGTYNGNVVFQPTIEGYPVPADERKQTIAGYEFRYYSVAFFIWVWKDGILTYSLAEAYDNGDLTAQEIGSIHRCHVLVNSDMYKKLVKDLVVMDKSVGGVDKKTQFPLFRQIPDSKV